MTIASRKATQQLEQRRKQRDTTCEEKSVHTNKKTGKSCKVANLYVVLIKGAHTLKHTLTHTDTRTDTHRHTHAHNCTHTQTQTHTHTNTHTHAHTKRYTPAASPLPLSASLHLLRLPGLPPGAAARQKLMLVRVCVCVCVCASVGAHKCGCNLRTCACVCEDVPCLFVGASLCLSGLPPGAAAQQKTVH